MARPVDTSVATFLQENPEYLVSNLTKTMPKMRDFPLREGAPSSLAAVRGQAPSGERVTRAMKISQDAYRKWVRRRSGALRYRSQPSVSEHLGDVQSQYDPAPKSERRLIPTEDTGLSEMEEFEDTGLIPFVESGYTQDVWGLWDSATDEATAPTLKQLVDRERVEAQRRTWEDPLYETIRATESGESPEAANNLSWHLRNSESDEVTQTDLGGGKIEIDIDNEDPDKRIRFVYDKNQDTLYEF